MNKDLELKLNQYVKARSRKKRWLTLAISLCAVVALGTSYVLINPADTQSGTAYCGYEEHVHTDECYEKVLTCELPEEGHTHSESCYAQQTAAAPETNENIEYITEEYYACGLEETDGHSHTDECYSFEPVCICENTEEGHEHTGACYEQKQILICGEQEVLAHHHDETCLAERQIPVNVEKSEEVPAEAAEPVCVCGLEESEPHQHTEDCYTVNYDKPVCGKDVHKHTLQCFSNPAADVESAAVWEQSFDKVELTGDWNKDEIHSENTACIYYAYFLDR